MINQDIDRIRRVELALIQKDRPALCKATKLAKEYAKTIKTEGLAAHWLQLINKMEDALKCEDNRA